MHLNEQEIVRRKAREELEKLGIEAYPSELYEVTHKSREIINSFKEEKADEYQEVSIAGRIMSRRIMGSASFAELQDEAGRIQIYLRRDDLCPGEDKTLYNTVFKKLLDIGDIIGVKGHVFKTKTGETSVYVKELKLLSKSLKPLPVVKESVDEEGIVQIHDSFTDLLLKTFPLIKWIVQFRKCIANFFSVYNRFKTFHQSFLFPMLLCKWRHLYGIIDDVRWLD